MLCRTCNAESGHIITRNGRDTCHSCGMFTEAGGTNTTGLLSRNSLKVRQEAVMHEGDILHPFYYDAVRRKPIPNREFIKQFPNQSHEYYTSAQLLDAGYTNLPKHLEKRKKKIERKKAKEEAKVIFEGTPSETINHQSTLIHAL